MNNYPIQKVLHYHLAKEKKNFKITSPYAIMEKLDGWYVYIDFLDGKTEGLKSSAGRIIPSLKYLSDKLSNYSFAGNGRLIFEATIPGLKFHETNGILNRKYELAENVVLNLHDAINFDNPSVPFIDRYLYLENMFDEFQDCLENQVALIPIIEIATFEEVFKLNFNKITTTGGEGIILKNTRAGYSFGKRNSDVMKIKEEVTEDCIVIDVLKGEGKYQNTTGALLVVRENGKCIPVSGMTDNQREAWWENPGIIKGKTVEVKAMKELPDGTLREARFKAVRYDK